MFLRFKSFKVLASLSKVSVKSMRQIILNGFATIWNGFARIGFVFVFVVVHFISALHTMSPGL